MILVLGVGIVGKAVIDFLKNKANVCFYDDKIKSLPDIPSFESWDNIKLVVASPGIALEHDMMQEAVRRNIKITNDIEIFLNQEQNGVKIGITGTSGKSTTCALLAHVLSSYDKNIDKDRGKNKVLIGGNFGVSPLRFLLDNQKADYYILELSSYQLELMDINLLHDLDFGIITNIYPSHLDRHGSFDDYIGAKCKILSAKNKLLGYCPLFNNWDLPKANIPSILPDSPLFEREEYQYCWGIIDKILDYFNLDKNIALKAAQTYQVLPFRQQIISSSPIMIINDSKSTNAIAAKQAVKNIKGPLCWVAGGAGEIDQLQWQDLDLSKENIKYVYISKSAIGLQKVLDELNIQYHIEPNLENATKNAYKFALENNLTLLFSPGYQSFDEFKNFEERGMKFNEYIQKLQSLK